MRTNVECTIGDVLQQVKDSCVALHMNPQAIFADGEWHVYVPYLPEVDFQLTTPCCVTPPPTFDDETDEEIIPDFALQRGMDGSVMADMIQDVVISVLSQRPDASLEDILFALNYYDMNDAFYQFN